MYIQSVCTEAEVFELLLAQPLPVFRHVTDSHLFQVFLALEGGMYRFEVSGFKIPVSRPRRLVVSSSREGAT